MTISSSRWQQWAYGHMVFFTSSCSGIYPKSPLWDDPSSTNPVDGYPWQLALLTFQVHWNDVITFPHPTVGLRQMFFHKIPSVSTGMQPCPWMISHPAVAQDQNSSQPSSWPVLWPVPWLCTWPWAQRQLWVLEQEVHV